MVDILDEIKEDLRNEKAQKFWNKYGRMIMVALALFVGGTALVSGYKQYAEYRATKDASEFSTAIDLIDGQSRDEALKKLSQMGSEASAGYKTLALFSKANVLYKAGDKVAAAAAYDDLSKTSGVDALYRELATVYSVSIQMDLDKPDYTAMDKRLEPLTQTGHPWRFSALELQGLIAMQQGDSKKAKEIFNRIVADLNAPSTIKMRAQRVSSVLSY